MDSANFESVFYNAKTPKICAVCQTPYTDDESLFAASCLKYDITTSGNYLRDHTDGRPVVFIPVTEDNFNILTRMYKKNPPYKEIVLPKDISAVVSLHDERMRAQVKIEVKKLSALLSDYRARCALERKSHSQYIRSDVKYIVALHPMTNVKYSPLY